MALSLSNIFFHCLASSGAGARRRAGVVEKDCENVLPVGTLLKFHKTRSLAWSIPQENAVLVSPSTCEATRRLSPVSPGPELPVFPIVSLEACSEVSFGGQLVFKTRRKKWMADYTHDAFPALASIRSHGFAQQGDLTIIDRVIYQNSS